MKEKARHYTPSPIPRLEDALLTTYIMLLEHDSRNHRHLVDACLLALLRKYIAERLHRGSNDYPTEDTCNVLAVALFWHMTSQGVCFERSHSKSVDLTIFPSDPLNRESNNNGNSTGSHTRVAAQSHALLLWPHQIFTLLSKHEGKFSLPLREIEAGNQYAHSTPDSKPAIPPQVLVVAARAAVGWVTTTHVSLGRLSLYQYTQPLLVYPHCCPPHTRARPLQEVLDAQIFTRIYKN
jgi:hypothetical protein